MNIKIEEISKYRLAYIRQIGPYDNNNIQTMEKLKDWARSKSILNDTSIILGIAHDNPEITKLENCHYDVCIVISKDFQINNHDDINEGCLSGGKYAVFKIKHIAEEVQKAWKNIFLELLKQGYRIDDSISIFERYNQELINNHYCEICVPVNY